MPWVNKSNIEFIELRSIKPSTWYSHFSITKPQWNPRRESDPVYSPTVPCTSPFFWTTLQCIMLQAQFYFSENILARFSLLRWARKILPLKLSASCPSMKPFSLAVWSPAREPGWYFSASLWRWRKCELILKICHDSKPVWFTCRIYW